MGEACAEAGRTANTGNGGKAQSGKNRTRRPAITGVLARELGPRKIRVNSLSPGPVATEGAKDLVGSDFVNLMVANTPLGRVGQPEDFGSLAVFLASSDSAWLTGETLIASGGLR